MREVVGGFMIVLCLLALFVLVPLAALRPRLVARLYRFLPENPRRGVIVAITVALALALGVVGGAILPSSQGNGPTSTSLAQVKTSATPSHSAKPKQKKKASPKPKKSKSAAPKAPAAKATASATRPSVRIVFVNVGQGDAEIIRAGNYDCLIDGGPSGEAWHVESELRRAGVSRLDLLLVTHPHADHIGDLPEVIADYRPARAIVDEGSSTATYAHLRSALGAAGTHVMRDFRGQSLRMGPLSARVLSPGGLSGDLNGDSVVLLLDVYGRRFLFTGDCVGSNESIVGELVARGPPVYLLKVAHHGPAYSTSSTFLNEVRPRYAVIEVGANSYGHPASSTVNRLKAEGTRIYSTQKDGDIALTIASSGAVTWHFSASSRPVTSGVGAGSSSSSSSTVTGSAGGSTIVYITETGECYHRDGCRYLSHSKIPITLKQAKARGYRPCSVCKPPQ